MQCNTMQYNAKKCNAMQCKKCNAIQYNTTLNLLSNFQATQSCETLGQCNAIQCNTMQYNAICCYLSYISFKSIVRIIIGITIIPYTIPCHHISQDFLSQCSLESELWAFQGYQHCIAPRTAETETVISTDTSKTHARTSYNY